MIPQKDKIFSLLVPDNYKDIKEQVNEDKTIIENINPNTINIVGALLSEKFNQKPFLLGKNLDESIEALNLEQIKKFLIGMDTNNLDVTFLKPLLLFKGTLIDLQYLLKLTGLDVKIQEPLININHYNNGNLYNSGMIYNESSVTGKLCSIEAEATILEKYKGIVEVTTLANTLKQILNTRLYYCIELSGIKFRILFSDTLNLKLSENISINTETIIKDYTLRRYFKDGKYSNVFNIENGNSEEYYNTGYKYNQNISYGNIIPNLFHFKQKTSIIKNIKISEVIENKIIDRTNVNIYREIDNKYNNRLYYNGTNDLGEKTEIIYNNKKAITNYNIEF